MLSSLIIKKNRDNILFVLVYIAFQIVIIIYADEILFGSFLHNYYLMVKGGKLTDIVNDWGVWKKYSVESLKRDSNTSLAKNQIGLLFSFHHVFKGIYSYNIQSYDARDDVERYGKNCDALHRTFYQGSCPSCYAFALASALGARICLLHSIVSPMIPSPYRIYDCSGNYCENMENGLDASMVMSVMREGVPDIKESPQTFGWGCHRGVIRSKNFKEVCGTSWMKREIIMNGPVIMLKNLAMLKMPLIQFDEWKYFFEGELDFTPGKNNNYNHALTIIGWGLHPIPHWIVKNSWGAKWGRDGAGRVPWTKLDCAFSFEPLIYTTDGRPMDLQSKIE